MMQQGRVQLDADWNEQVDISGHLLQSLARDLVGPHGGPGESFMVEGGFRRKALRNDFAILEGHYYVDGLLCENDQVCTYTTQPDYPLPPSQLLDKAGDHLVYLDVWQRVIRYVEDPDIREVALGGPDTTVRTKLVWQVKLLPLGSTKKTRQKDSSAVLQKAVTRAQLPTLEASTLPDQAGYRGLENQLYRVEINDAGNDARHATFKWSRNNGSVVAPILEIGGHVLTVAPRAGPDSVPFTPGDWLEVSDDEYELQGRAEPLRRVDYVDRRKMRVTLNLPPPSTVGTTPRKHPLLRRWDQKEDEGVKIAQR